MKLKLKRIARKPEYTIGKLYIDGVYYCDTLEDRDRGLTQAMGREECLKRKVYGMTAIPSGTYKVIINYSNKYKQQMPQILNVPAFDGIRIHSGNTHLDTFGCVLVGQNKEVGKVINSRAMYKPLFEKMKKASEITITIE